jgi:hypothetical protein
MKKDTASRSSQGGIEPAATQVSTIRRRWPPEARIRSMIGARYSGGRVVTGSAITAMETTAPLEPIREDLVHVEGVAAKRRSMMRIMAIRTKAAALGARR